MSISRYDFVNKINKSNKIFYSTGNYSVKINKAIEKGLITFKAYVLKDGERIEQIAYKFYGDSNYWWVIAAASGIGWSLQIPPGTILRIPDNLSVALGISR